MNSHTDTAVPEAFQTPMTYSVHRVKGLACSRCYWHIQHKQKHLWCCCCLGWGQWGVCKESAKAKDAWQPLEKCCLDLLKDSMAKQTPTAWACVCTMVSLQSLGFVLKLVPVLTEASPAWSWVMFKSLVTSWIWCFHPICSSHFPLPCCSAKGLRIRTIYFPNSAGEGGPFWINSE